MDGMRLDSNYTNRWHLPRWLVCCSARTHEYKHGEREANQANFKGLLPGHEIPGVTFVTGLHGGEASVPPHLIWLLGGWYKDDDCFSPLSQNLSLLSISSHPSPITETVHLHVSASTTVPSKCPLWRPPSFSYSVSQPPSASPS